MPSRAPRRAWIIAAAIATLGAAAAIGLGDGVPGRAAAIAAVALALWLSELVPLFVPTFVLLAAVPLVIGTRAPGFDLPSVLGWCADPVLALFLGGFALGRAAQRHGLDRRLVAGALALARGRRVRLLVLVMAVTLGLSMWMSNVAAAAMMLGVVRPLAGRDPRLRGALLLGVAMAANLAGMATPIGSGPNAIAIARLEPAAPTFLQWMAFALPLTVAMLALAAWLVRRRYALAGGFAAPPAEPAAADARPGLTAVMFAIAIAGWLSEPWHHVPPAVVALALVALLFGSGLLATADVRALEWPTLVLIAGGLVLGRLLERSGLLEMLIAGSPLATLPGPVKLGGLLSLAALLSALMSNTATAAMLVPLAMRLDPAPSTAVLLALACSFGVPFVISTPANAIAVADGGATSGDLLAVGLPIMLLGLAILALTGRATLTLFGMG